MSFHTHARLVRRSDLPFHRRRSAFRSCIQPYRWLIRQKFQTTYIKFSEHFEFDDNTADADERLNQAMNALELERHLFLEKLHLFDKKRIKEKIQGRRSPSKEAIEALYKNMKLVTSNPENKIASDE